MNFTCVPIIVILSYIIGEIYNICFGKSKKAKKLLPIITGICGGLIAIIIYYTNPEIIFNAENIWIALGIGISSGVSSTYTNEIINKIFKKGE